MFADDKSIENMQQLFIEFKKYLELQKEYTKLEVTEKLSKLLSTLLLVLLVVILGVVVLFHLSFTLVYILAPLVGGLMMSFALITCFHILLIVLLVLFRKKLIIDPTVKLIAELFLDNEFEIFMDNTTNTTPVTLESIAQKKAMLLQEIRLQKEIMTGLTQEIFAPLEPATNKANAMMRAFNTGMAVFDGIVLGVKVMKKFRKIFG